MLQYIQDKGLLQWLAALSTGETVAAFPGHPGNRIPPAFYILALQ